MLPRRPLGDELDGDDHQSHEPLDDGEGTSGRKSKQNWTLLVIVVAVLAFGSWLGFEAYQAKSSLYLARSSAAEAKDALSQGDTEAAAKWVGEAHSHAQAARNAAHSLPWNVAAVVPWLGSPFKTGQEISDVVLSLVDNVLRPAQQVGAAISPDRLLEGNRLDVGLLRDAAPQLSEIAAATTTLDADARAITDPTYLSPLRDARAQLQEQIFDISATMQTTALAARLAPSMMGADGPRTYFMGFQTNAEARGTGGLLGAFGILRFDNGTATVDDVSANDQINGPFTPIDLGAEYATQYGYTNPTTDSRNSNQSSHFPYAAQIWKSMWAQESGMEVDGAIAIDPVALSYILSAIGSVTMSDGEVITRDNVVELTESTAYSRFPTDQRARQKYLQDIANAVVTKMTGRLESPRQLLKALGKAVSERRIAVWSSSPNDQKLLEETSLAHVIPDDSAPYAEVVINNLGGDKLDYYLRRNIEYAADGCDADTRMSTVTIGLTNTATGGPLPDYVASSAGLRPELPISAPRGTMFTSVRLLATQGAELVSVVSNGQRVPAFSNVERGHPSFEVQVAIPPGQSGELSFHLSEPTAPGAARVPIQPLLDTIAPAVSVPECTR